MVTAEQQIFSSFIQVKTEVGPNFPSGAQDDEIFIIANMHFGSLSGKNLLERMWK